jgi:hypothetical protein
MSGYAEEVAGGDDATGVVFLEKPFTPPSVTRAIAAALGSVASARPGEDWIT